MTTLNQTKDAEAPFRVLEVIKRVGLPTRSGHQWGPSRNRVSRSHRLLLVPALCGILFGQTHFQPVDTTGLPYAIVITGVDVFGEDLAIGGEIAVFDGDLCVGAGYLMVNTTYNFPPGRKTKNTVWKALHPVILWSFVSGQL